MFLEVQRPLKSLEEGQDSPKMAQRWPIRDQDTPKMDPSWRNTGQDSTKMAQDCPKMAKIAPSSENCDFSFFFIRVLEPSWGRESVQPANSPARRGLWEG